MNLHLNLTIFQQIQHQQQQQTTSTRNHGTSAGNHVPIHYATVKQEQLSISSPSSCSSSSSSSVSTLNTQAPSLSPPTSAPFQGDQYFYNNSNNNQMLGGSSGSNGHGKTYYQTGANGYVIAND